MRKILLLTTLLLSQTALFAQAPTTIQCTLSVEQVCELQPYHLDHPKQEETMLITTDLINEFTTIYALVNQGNTGNLSTHIDAINTRVQDAQTLGMNYSMFQADLDYIQSLN